MLSRLGAGGMGVVFKAEHLLLRRLAAVKVLDLPDDDSDQRPLQRFLTEIRTLGTLDHPNVVAPMDAGQVPSPGHGEPGSCSASARCPTPWGTCCSTACGRATWRREG